MALAKGLADALGGRYIFTPPKCLVNFTGVFPRSSTHKNAFFALSLYASAYNARQLLALDCPVVLNGYWSEQAEFMLSKLFKRKMDLPPIGDPVYDIPADLMAPDIVILHDSPYYGPLKDAGNRAPPKKLVVYNNFHMRGAEFIFARYESNITETVYRILSIIKKKFDHVFNFGPAVPKYLLNI
uniref:Uncharacterized protein n=1 Tax=Clastoptera arizonana TaxID=38151 RepID=A0A1B6C8H2_9HEMI